MDKNCSLFQKSQGQSRTSGNGGNRRKTRVMSDDEDMIMDETNQVCIPYGEEKQLE